MSPRHYIHNTIRRLKIVGYFTTLAAIPGFWLSALILMLLRQQQHEEAVSTKGGKGD